MSEKSGSGLRPFQIDCLRSVDYHWNQKHIARQLVVLPTGTGKATIAAAVPDAISLPRTKRTMTWVHREELAFQMAEKCQAANPDRRVGIEMAGSYAGDADMVIASVPTLTLKKRGSADEYNERMRSFNPEHFGLFVADEVHHATADAWVTALRYMRILKREDPRTDALFLGMTATPGRSDGVGLSDIMDFIPFQRGLRQMISEGWCADVIGYQVFTDVNLDNVDYRKGDFVLGQLANAVNTRERNRIIVDAYQKHGEDAPGIAFCVNRQHAMDLTDEFNAAGIKAVYIDGETPKAERREIFRAYRAAEIPMLCNCQIATEGTDLPVATVGIFARPYRSRLFYEQCYGRLSRPYPAPEDAAKHTGWRKKYSIVIDVFDNTLRHDLVGIPSLFGLPARFNAAGKSLTQAVKEVEQLELEHTGCAFRDYNSLEDIRSSIRRIDFLRSPVIPEDARKCSKFLWLELVNKEKYILSFPSTGATATIEVDLLGRHSVYLGKAGARTLLGEFDTPQQAFSCADSMAAKEDKILLLARSPWRREAPTDKQARMLHWKHPQMKARFPDWRDLHRFAQKRFADGNSGWSKGSLSTLIDSVTVAR